MIMSLRSNQRLLHTRQNLFCLRQRQPQIGDLGKAGGSIDLYQVDTICRDVGARFDQSQNPTHARSPGQKDKDKDRRIAPGPIPPISGQSPSLDGYTLIALDGTQYFCSNKLSCQNCSTRKHANGQIDYFHTVVAASVVKPSKNWVLPLRPEFIEPQQGYDKQDCESRAARRWLALNGLRYSKLNPVYLGDDIYSKQPVCEEVLAVGAHFLFVCKPDSHKTMNEYLSGVEVPSLSRKVKRGKKFFTYTWRWMLGLPIRDGKDALEVNWLEITIHDSNRKITYRNSFITDLPVDADNVEHLAAAGRARWKIENETFNTLKTKEYNLEHNFGHGKNNLSAVLATLNLIAFAIHRAAELADKTWKAAIEVAGSRVRFFGNLRALTAYLLFPSL